MTVLGVYPGILKGDYSVMQLLSEQGDYHTYKGPLGVEKSRGYRMGDGYIMMASMSPQ